MYYEKETKHWWFQVYAEWKINLGVHFYHSKNSAEFEVFLFGVGFNLTYFKEDQFAEYGEN